MRREDHLAGMRSQPGGLLHEALVYDDDGTFVERVATFLREGVDEGPTIAVLNRRHWALLREELGKDAEQVSFTDCDDFYVRPIDALAAYDATLRRLVAGGATSVRVTGEIPLGPTRAGWGDWISYEAIVNRALADRPLHVLCLYDAKTVPDAVIEGVWQTHPCVDANSVGPLYHEPHDVVAAFTPVPARTLALRPLPTTRDATAFREELSAALAAARAPHATVLNMLVAANEVFENALEHGGGLAGVRAGLVDGWFVCEIEDRGPGLDDPLAGYLPPASGEQGQRGLWLARRLVSRVELIPAEPGLIVRMWL
jgi:anti-sigma regulatory factor (Ser/Thr protein kinase)